MNNRALFAIFLVKHNVRTKQSNKHFAWFSFAVISGAGGLRFKSRAGLIEHSVANSSPPLQRFFEKSCVARAQ